MNRFTYFTRFRSTHGAPDLQAMGRSALFSFVVFLQAGCATPAIVPLGVLQLASEQGAQGRTFGGISGLDHHPTSKAWILISDDRSTHGPARFYEAVLNWRQDRLVNAQIRGQRPLQNEKALLFPPESDRSNIDDEVADPESIRFDPIDDSIIWSSEGDSSRGFSPTIRRMTMEGGALGVIPLPSALGFDAAEDRGAIPNKTVEGLAWTAGGQALWAAMEGPLKQDRLSSDNDQGALVRLTLLTRTGETIRQKAYEVDPVVAVAGGEDDELLAGAVCSLTHQVAELVDVARLADQDEAVLILPNVVGRRSLQQLVEQPSHVGRKPPSTPRFKLATRASVRPWGTIRLELGPMPRQRPWTASVTVSDVLQGIYAPSASLASAKAL